MAALIGLLIIVILSIVVVRIGAIALELTGLSHDVAAFQAQSAFSGTGFTTSESETIVSHPVRRRIARILILLGSAGITTTIAAFVLTFVGQTEQDILTRAGLLLAGLLTIFLLSKSKLIQGILKKVILKALSRSETLKIYDYSELLGLGKGYSVSRISIKENNWTTGKPLKDLGLNQEGTLVLSIQRKVSNEEKFMVPSGETVIQPGDTLTLYSRNECSKCLFERPKGEEGDKAHQMRCELEEKRKEIIERTGGFVEV